MAYSYVQYTGNGSIKTFSVPFTYISKSHIAVKVNGVLKAAGTDYSWDTDSSITFVTAPGTGLTVDIRRASSPSQRLIDFQDGSTLTQDILDADSNQNFFMAQEAIDAVASNIALASDGVFDAVNKRIKNVADPVNAQDAVTKVWAETALSSQLAQATTQATNSASSASASATSAAASAASATSASGSAATATTKATDSSNSATASAASAAAALTSKNAAATSETNAASSASSASSSATAANTSAVNAATSASGASASASTATTKASDASGSATAASNSASAAATSATNAASSASSASSSATTAATQATNSASSATAAAGSATSASTSATTATTKAAEAATSATNAATSATNSANSATAAATSASDANSSAVSAASSAASAAALLDNFDDRYLGSKTSAPTLDNDGNALLVGALYFDSTTGKMRVYTASGWLDASSASVATLAVFNYTATAGQTSFSGADLASQTLTYTVGSLFVTLNGIDLKNGTDYTATTGSSIVLTSGAVAGDELRVYAFGSFLVADTYTRAQADALFIYKDASGNVGIGAPSTGAKLQVQGFIQTGEGASSQGGIQYPYSSNGGSRSWRTKNDEQSFGDFVIQQSTTQTGSSYVDRVRINESGVFQFNSGYGSAAPAYGCRAWVNFNGTGTVSIRAGGNVSSITDNGTGDYTVNFTNAMVDANYSTVVACSRNSAGGAFATNIATNDSTGGDVAPTTTAIRVVANGGASRGGQDVAYYSVSVFR